MAHGNIYPAEKVDAALANYFRPGNLGALRELALLWVADQVDEALEEYREAPRHRRAVGDAGTGASSRSPGAPGRRVARSGGRRAWRRGPTASSSACTSAVDEGLAGRVGRSSSDHRQLLADLGGEYHEITGRRRRRRRWSSSPGRRTPPSSSSAPAGAVRWAELAARLGHQPGDPAVGADRRARDLARADRGGDGAAGPACRRHSPVLSRAAQLAGWSLAVAAPGRCSRWCSHNCATRVEPPECAAALPAARRRGRRRSAVSARE